MSNKFSSTPETTDAGPVTHIKDHNLVHLGLIIAAGIFATTLAQPIVLGKLPLQFLLKNQFHVDRTKMASFFFLSALAWYFKPFAGILVDAFPLFGTRRRNYLLISSVLAAATWIYIGFGSRTYDGILAGCIVLSVFLVIGSTVTGAYLVQAGQELGATGRLTSLRQTIQNVCQVIQGPLGGFLAAGAFSIATGANAVMALSVFPIAYFYMKEQKVKVSPSETLLNAGHQLKLVLGSKTLWIAIVLIGLFYFAPGLSTVLLFKQTDELKFKPEYIGFLGSLQGITGIIAAVLYGFLIKRFSLRTMIIAGVLLNAAGTMLYLFYNGATLAAFIDAQNNFFFTLCEVALMNLAAKATPVGCEGLGYSLMLSMRNVASQGADVLGSSLADHHWSYSSLVFLNSGTTLLVLLILPFLPKALLGTSDAAAS